MSASIWAPGNNLVTVDAESTNLYQVFTATDSQIVFILTEFSYNVGTGSLAVYRGGQRLILGTDWTETTSTSISLTGFTIAAGEVIEVVAVLGSASSASIAAAASAAEAAASAVEAAASAAAINPAEYPSTVTADTIPMVNPTGDGWLYKTVAQIKILLGLGSAAYTNSDAYQAADADIATVAASQAEMEAGTEAALRSISPLRVKQAIAALASTGPTRMTEVATTSGTSVDITGIPSTAKRITLLLDSVSTNGTSQLLIQLGSGSIQTTGYESVASYSGNAGQFDTEITGFVLEPPTGPAATGKRHGQVVFTHRGSNRYVGAGTVADYGYGVTANSGGAVSLSGALDRIRITTLGAANTFDAGAIQVLYE